MRAGAMRLFEPALVTAPRCLRPVPPRGTAAPQWPRAPRPILAGVAVARRGRFVALLGHPFDAWQRSRFDRLAERDLVRAARRFAAVALDQSVDGHLRHPPPGRELPAGDRDQPARGLVQ